jgi:ubiquinone/menaquinone biosynthesis C-methylase UbiE
MIKPYGYVNAEYLRRVAGTMSGIKSQSYALMDLENARSVLDAGCGPGIDTVAMASQVSDGARIIGIDVDPDMIAAAEAHARDQKAERIVSHVLADVYDLPFEDAYFDACRAERLFQNIPEAHDSVAILGELLRVLRSGGRVVLIDPDYGSASVAVDDVALERKMMQYCATKLRPNGLIARRFYALLKDAGVGDVKVHTDTLVFTTVEDSPYGTYLINAAQDAGFIDDKEAAQWKSVLTDREQAGTFFATLNILTVAGTKK